MLLLGFALGDVSVDVADDVTNELEVLVDAMVSIAPEEDAEDSLPASRGRFSGHVLPGVSVGIARYDIGSEL